MTLAEARLTAESLLRSARAGDRDAAFVLVDVLAETGHERLAEGLFATLKRHRESVPIALIRIIARTLFPERCAPPRAAFAELLRRAEETYGWEEMPLARPEETRRLLGLYERACITGERDDVMFALRQTDGAIAGQGIRALRVPTWERKPFYFDYIDLGDHLQPTVFYGRSAHRFWVTSPAAVVADLERRYGRARQP